MTGREFRSALGRIGISQAELARLLERTPNTISGWVTANEIPAAGRLFCRVALDYGLDYAKEALRP